MLVTRVGDTMLAHPPVGGTLHLVQHRPPRETCGGQLNVNPLVCQPFACKRGIAELQTLHRRMAVQVFLAFSCTWSGHSTCLSAQHLQLRTLKYWMLLAAVDQSPRSRQAHKKAGPMLDLQKASSHCRVVVQSTYAF
jgi:hypothetical protein